MDKVNEEDAKMQRLGATDSVKLRDLLTQAADFLTLHQYGEVTIKRSGDFYTIERTWYKPKD